MPSLKLILRAPAALTRKQLSSHPEQRPRALGVVGNRGSNSSLSPSLSGFTLYHPLAANDSGRLSDAEGMALGCPHPR